MIQSFFPLANCLSRISAQWRQCAVLAAALYTGGAAAGLTAQPAPVPVPSAPVPVPASAPVQSAAGAWSGRVVHLIGFENVKPKASGTLTIDETGLRFAQPKGVVTLGAPALLAASAGGERVELWGTKGRVLRAVIPYGGGSVLAAFAHHHIGLLTVEYRQPDGSRHAAVFALPKAEMDRALAALPKFAAPEPEVATPHCEQEAMDRAGVLVIEPDWTSSDVPEAYRALLSESLVARLKSSDAGLHVYRYGQPIAGGGCARYTIRLSATRFNAGNQVLRVALGPAGMFVGTTRFAMHVTVHDAATREEKSDSIAVSLRGQSESYGIAAKEAKKIAGQFAKMRSETQRAGMTATASRIR